MGIIVIFNICVRVVVAIIIIIGIFKLLLLILHMLCHFYGFLISLSLSSHETFMIIYSVALLYFTLFYRELSSYSFLPV